MHKNEIRCWIDLKLLLQQKPRQKIKELLNNTKKRGLCTREEAKKFENATSCQTLQVLQQYCGKFPWGVNTLFCQNP